MPQLCLPEGPRDARIAFVGEAPGETEVSLGRPFVGASGQELDRWLPKAGIHRRECYMTNVMQTRPASNNFGFFYEDPLRLTPKPELVKGWERLRTELAQVKPNVICCLGGEALRAVTGLQRSITSWRGSILSSPSGKCIGTFHPSYILQSDYSDAPVFQLDLRRVLSESLTPALNLPKFNFEINPSLSRILAFLDTRPTRLAVDIETTGDLVRCIGLADSARHALCIPFLTSGGGEATSFGNGLGGCFPELFPSASTRGSAWSIDDEHLILTALYSLLADPSVAKVLQNFPFDSTILSKQMGLDITNLHMDTLLAQHTCHPELQKGLDFQASIYTRIPYWSDYDASNDSSTWLYNCYDCASTFEISEVHDVQLRNLGLAEFYHSHVQPSMLGLTRAQNRGIGIDTTLRADLAKKAKADLAQAKDEIRTITGMDLNPNSPKQMQEFLYGKLGMKVQYKRDPKTRQFKVTCDEEHLLKLKKLYPLNSSLIDFCLQYREKNKLISSWLEGKLYAGRIYTTYSAAGTLTGRLSSSGKVVPIILPEEGANLQQVDRGELRRIFIADPAWVLIKSDLEQADFRVVMWKARVLRIIEKFDDPDFDVHRWNAAVNILGCPEHEVTKPQRMISKISIHGSNYGMGPDKAAAQRDFQTYLNQFPNPVAVCQGFQERYYAGFPEIKGVYWPGTQHQLNLNRTITTQLGRRRMFMGRWGDDLFRQAYAFEPQATVGDIINRAFALGNELFDDRECFPLLQVHDEILWHCRADKADQYLPRIRGLMEYPVRFPGIEKPMVIPAEITVGLNWYDQKELKSWKLTNQTTSPLSPPQTCSTS